MSKYKITKDKQREINLGVNLYDMNKQAFNSLDPLDAETAGQQIAEMGLDFIDRTKYWMLLNNERRDYTVFIPLTKEGIIQDLKETIFNRGEVLSVDKQQDGNYEIWIRDPASKENFVYYLFDYTFGIVQS